MRNLVKKYGTHLAVDHLDFKIESGRIYGFLGPNGAGKSTTMNIMTGYLGATEGEVLIDGHDILKEPEEAKRHIGYLPEQPPLYVDMTVREYLEFAAELKGIRKAKRDHRDREDGEDLGSGEQAHQKPFQRLQAASRTCAGNPGIPGDHHTG